MKDSRKFGLTGFLLLSLSLLFLAGGPAGAGIATDPQPLNLIPVPLPVDLDDYIKNRKAAIALGKALFWDMQVGSDGVTACATCHHLAGVDSRFRNTLNPGGDGNFQTRGPNSLLRQNDFPFHLLADPDDTESFVLRSHDDRVGSQGVFNVNFTGVVEGSDKDRGKLVKDGTFRVGKVNTRQSTGRNTPSAINAVLNHRNFWDGRANNIFNGVNPFGASDMTNGVFVDNGGTLIETLIRIDNASLASQAVGPPLSSVEMSWNGRSFAELGQKMLSLQPLAKQLVHPNDPVLGRFSNASLAPDGSATGAPGLSATYAQGIRAAFPRKYWGNTGQVVRYDNKADYAALESSGSEASTIVANGDPVVLSRSEAELDNATFSQMEANFAFFWGLAIMMYESTLVSDDTPLDRFLAGDLGALTPQEQEGFDVFQGRGLCINCHNGAALTNASTAVIFGVAPVPIDLIALLNGAQEVPPVVTTATGTATLDIDSLRSRIVFDLNVADITGVTAAHIHEGVPGANGPVIFNLSTVPFTDRVAGTLRAADLMPTATIPDFEAAIEAIALGGAYVNVHTGANPGGEIRGRILQDALVFEAAMTGANVVPPVVTAAAGGGEFFMNAGRTQLDVVMEVADAGPAVNVTAIRIHSGLPGANGPAMFEMDLANLVDCPPPEPAGCVSIIENLLPLDLIPSPGIATFADAMAAISNEQAYVQLSNGANPGGLVRGQLRPLFEAAIVPIELMNMTEGRAFYDTGFYNIAVTPTSHDPGIGNDDPFGFPLGYADLGILKRDGLLPAGKDAFTPPLPPGTASPPNNTATDGAFKVPGLRNVALTFPFFHNGGTLTLRQVVDFYTRGGNFAAMNVADLAPDIAPIGGMDEQSKVDLVAFLLALTDERVANESDVFSRPQFFLANGQKGGPNSINGDCSVIGPLGFRDCERVIELPATGAGGRAALGLSPLSPGVDHQAP